MRILIDSYCWIEYLEGSETGKKVSGLLERNNEIYVIDLIIAEIINKAKRQGKDADVAYNMLASNARVIEISSEMAKKAGLLHAEMKEKIKDFGLIDAFILIAAREVGAKIYTGDKHFKGFKEAVFIK